MNKIFNKMFPVGTSSSSALTGSDRNAPTSGKLFDELNEQLKPLGLYIDTVTPKQLGVWRGNDCIGYYPTMGSIKKAIKAGTVGEPYNK